MNLTPECITCIFSQSLRVCKTLGIDKHTTKRVLDRVANMVEDWSFDETPPQIAARVYPQIADILQVDDIYLNYKHQATKKALEFIPFIENMINNSSDRFIAALKVSVAGNVIDLAAMKQFDLNEEISKIFDLPFSIDDSESLRKELKRSKNLLVVGDNAGEHLFDKVMMHSFKELFPKLNIFYAVRGKPIINDVTKKEAKEAGIDEVAKIIDSGVDTPGLDLNRANKEMLTIFNRADIVLAKGMGNYESLCNTTHTIYFLLKVKCNVVASSLGATLGDIVCLKRGDNI